MTNFVVYHNSEKMGGALEEAPDGMFHIVTKKDKVKGCKGMKAWIIQGIATPRRYTLECRFMIEEVVEIDDPEFAYCASGSDGQRFDHFPLNGEEWFWSFFDLQNNFSYGFNEIDQTTPHHLEQFAASQPS